ncbi:hypothetical protein OHA71_06700 [Streptomyces sp. NBC_00444]|uniref:hypothetical protein n=1 Tax=Streptomyces sp. NBC_00444 TaxID=2975744 RepID=UPI002E1CE5D8
MTHTHSPAEWAAFLSLGVTFWATCAALLYLSYDADPSPTMHRAAGAVHQAAVHAGHDVNRAIATVRRRVACAARPAAVWAAALLLLLSGPTGGTR